jgi:hypothetical protein
VDFYRVFPFNPQSQKFQPGHAFHISRAKQGQGRFDIPELDGVMYCSRNPVSAIAEFIQFFRGQTITASHFERPDGLIIALAEFQYPDSKKLIDLDDPTTLAKLNIHPSQFLTHDRYKTKEVSKGIFRKMVYGFMWPSTLEASWTNACLFESRVRKKLSLNQPVRALSLDMPELREAAKILGVFVD